MNITVDSKNDLFVLSCNEFVSTLGFEVVFGRAKELASRLMRLGVEAEAPSNSEVGSIAQYKQYKSLLSKYETLEHNETWFDGRTPIAIQNAIELSIHTGNTVRIFYGDSESGKDWLEEFDTVGHISRSTGVLKSPLLVKGYSSGGTSVLPNCIVRMVDIDSGKELYRHPTYHTPEFQLGFNPCESLEGLHFEVKLLNEEAVSSVHARFDSEPKAKKYIEFLKGNINMI